MVEVLETHEPIDTVWLDFVAANLATGARAGALDGHPHAADLTGISPRASGTEILDTERFFPLAATYYRLSHQGGPLWIGTSDGDDRLFFTLHPTARDNRVLPALETFEVTTGSLHAFSSGESLPAGTYWLSGSLARLAGSAAHLDLCVGSEELARMCAPDEDEDEAGDETSSTSGGETSTTGGAELDGDSSTTPAPAADEVGCGCSTAPARHDLGWLLVLLLRWRRRSGLR